MHMKPTDENKKSNEPFDPRDTPEPPQFVDPKMRDRSEQNNDNAAGNNGRQERKNEPSSKEEKPKRLGESEIEIDDETTI